jgi:ribosomal protein S27AE
MASMKRGVGYCENTDCEDYAKGVFLLNHGDTFYCPRCRQLGKVEKERGFYTGNTDIFKEVRVEYNFDPINTVYREIAIVRDESLWGRNNVYTLQSPLIKTEKRALKVAEAILATISRARPRSSSPSTTGSKSSPASFSSSARNGRRAACAKASASRLCLAACEGPPAAVQAGGLFLFGARPSEPLGGSGASEAAGTCMPEPGGCRSSALESVTPGVACVANGRSGASPSLDRRAGISRQIASDRLSRQRTARVAYHRSRKSPKFNGDGARGFVRCASTEPGQPLDR